MIIPSHRSQQTLPRTLRSLEVAAKGLDIETIVVEDADGRGPSWARNRGLDKAKGDVVFFCDADDTVRPDFFSKPLARLESSGADMCFFSFSGGRKSEDAVYRGHEAIRERYMPAFFGYSFDDVRRWNGVETEYAYDTLDRLVSLEHRGSNGTSIATFSYSYQADGRRSSAVWPISMSGGWGRAR